MSDQDNTPPGSGDGDSAGGSGGGPGAGGPSDIRPVSITEEMKKSYLDYAMSVIVALSLIHI